MFNVFQFSKSDFKENAPTYLMVVTFPKITKRKRKYTFEMFQEVVEHLIFCFVEEEFSEKENHYLLQNMSKKDFAESYTSYAKSLKDKSLYINKKKKKDVKHCHYLIKNETSKFVVAETKYEFIAYYVKEEG